MLMHILVTYRVSRAVMPVRDALIILQQSLGQGNPPQEALNEPSQTNLPTHLVLRRRFQKLLDGDNFPAIQSKVVTEEQIYETLGSHHKM